MADVPTTLEGKVPLSTGGVMTDPFSPFVMSAAAGDETMCDEKTRSLARHGRCEANTETLIHVHCSLGTHSHAQKENGSYVIGQITEYTL